MRQPVLFVGHGSPMNAIEENDFTRSLPGFVREKPEAILAISAHWLTEGTKVLSAPAPRTIHDFGGFPAELFAVQYPAPGAPDLAGRIAQMIPEVEMDASWGLDHGTWSVLKHIYPKADVPVTQLSLDVRLDLEQHYELAKKLRPLRDEGVLILATGNVTHNLRMMRNGPAPAWALEFDGMIKDALIKRDLPELFAHDAKKHPLWALAHPSIDHYVPLLYAVGAADEQESPEFVYEGMLLSSFSMRSLRYG